MYLITTKELSEIIEVDERTIQNYAEEAEKDFSIMVRNERGIYNFHLFFKYFYLKVKKLERSVLKASDNDKNKNVKTLMDAKRILIDMQIKMRQYIPAEAAILKFQGVTGMINNHLNNIMETLKNLVKSGLPPDAVMEKIIEIFNDEKKLINKINYRKMLSDDDALIDDENITDVPDKPE